MYKSIIKKSLIAFATMTTLSATAAMAWDFEIVDNSQINMADVLSDINITIDNIGEAAKVNSSALGNNFVVSAEGTGPLDLNTSQVSRTDNIISRVNIDIHSTPLIDITSEAIANKTVVINKGTMGHNIINNNQLSAGAPPPPPPPVPTPTRRPDPLSDVSVTAVSIDDLKLKSTAGGNFGQFVLGGTGNVFNSVQSNAVDNTSLVDINIGNITNSLNIDSKAFGNSLVLVLGDIPE